MKSFLKLTLIFATIFLSNFAMAKLDDSIDDAAGTSTSVNPGIDPNLAMNTTGFRTEANTSHCAVGTINYCPGCCASEMQIARDKASAATQEAINRTRSKTGSGGM